MTGWREYQDQVADLFRNLGCLAEVEASVKGVRATHDIDVWVVFNRFGLEHRWAIECKYWNTPIPKEKVGTLKYVVDDVGADKGILVAESGFQPGARDAAFSTNILLTTLSNLQELAENDLQRMSLEKLEKMVIALVERTHDLYVWEDYVASKGQSGSVSSPRPGVDSTNYLKMKALLSILETGFRRIKVDRLPAPVGIDFDADKAVVANSKEEFIELAGANIEYVNAWVSKQESAIESALHEDSS